MSKDDQHIIDWILERTSEIRQRTVLREKKRPYKHKKRTTDNMIFYCKKCNNCWSKSPRWIDVVRYRKYPIGLMPTIGKKRKQCPECK